MGVRDRHEEMRISALALQQKRKMLSKVMPNRVRNKSFSSIIGKYSFFARPWAATTKIANAFQRSLAAESKRENFCTSLEKRVTESLAEV